MKKDEIAQFLEKKNFDTEKWYLDAALRGNDEEYQTDYPILLNHEKIILSVFGIAFVFGIIFALFFLPMLMAWILGLLITIPLGFLGLVMSDNLVNQAKAVFEESLSQNINKNHLIKILKLNSFPDSYFEFVMAFLYGISLVSFILLFHMQNLFHIELREWFLFYKNLHVLIGIQWESDLAWAFFIPISGFCLTGVLLIAWFFFGKYLPSALKSALYLPFNYIYQIFSGFHESFRSFVKIVAYILITWREYLASIRYLILTGIINLGKKHYISNIEVDYLLFVKTILLTISPLGYLICFIRAY